MKKIILGMILLLPTLSSAKITEETCRGIVRHAKLVMLYKQSGIPIDEMLRKNDEWFKNATTAEKNKANMTIQMAYSLAFYNDEKLNESQLNDFIADEYITCKKAMK
ncbi:hypothetical protein [Acinetobacter ursingii]|uniref:hypothetical protein n=1 Tax=Acinetobacter ursingii TaxID=108980 RepID=UPI0021D2D347|nr:hypothetical protein [Acinetobacter ursingii]MCU4571066.1 hypothetical protein [Acinetobacter ursingii]